MQRNITTVAGLPDLQLFELLRYALMLKASLGLANKDDYAVLKELLIRVETPTPQPQGIAAARAP